LQAAFPEGQLGLGFWCSHGCCLLNRVSFFELFGD
jgi:hypothetical protein